MLGVGGMCSTPSVLLVGTVDVSGVRDDISLASGMPRDYFRADRRR